MIAGIVKGFSSVMIVGSMLAIGAMAPAACTKAQDVQVATDVSKYGPAFCVAVEAIGGAAVPVIATICDLTEDVVVAILEDVGTPGADAGPMAAALAIQVRALPAFAEAERRKAARK